MELVMYQQCQIAILSTLYEFIYVTYIIKNKEQNKRLNFNTGRKQALRLCCKRNRRRISVFVSSEIDQFPLK